MFDKVFQSKKLWGIPPPPATKKTKKKTKKNKKKNNNNNKKNKKTICLVFVMLSRLFIAALWSPAGKGLTSWLLFVMSKCFLSLSYVVSWVRCGTWLYRFLILAAFLTYNCNLWPEHLDHFLVFSWSNGGLRFKLLKGPWVPLWMQTWYFVLFVTIIRIVLNCFSSYCPQLL